MSENSPEDWRQVSKGRRAVTHTDERRRQQHRENLSQRSPELDARSHNTYHFHQPELDARSHNTYHFHQNNLAKRNNGATQKNNDIIEIKQQSPKYATKRSIRTTQRNNGKEQRNHRNNYAIVKQTMRSSKLINLKLILLHC
jgi:hypothetical protein